MNVEVTMRTELEFEDLDDINEAQSIIVDEMSIEEILELADRQGNRVTVEVEEY